MKGNEWFLISDCQNINHLQFRTELSVNMNWILIWYVCILSGKIGNFRVEYQKKFWKRKLIKNESAVDFPNKN